jgi:SAM-dependent methyltransferase
MTSWKSYHNHLSNSWNFRSTDASSTGYEDVMDKLVACSKQEWLSRDEQARKELEQEVFDIYRAKDILPIFYFSEQGCEQEIRTVNQQHTEVKNGRISVGATGGLSFCRFWFPNMQEAYTLGARNVSLDSRFHNDSKLKRAIKICYQHRDEGDKAVIPQNIRRALELTNGGTIQNFKPLNAKAIWEYICPTMWGRVLDFSSGYGGRMIGAMTSNMRYHYTGIDPNTKTYNGLVALGDLINDTIGTTYEMHHTVSEDFDPEADAYDAAFSSPPYFNLETYCDEPTQCMNKCDNVDAWFELYVEPTLKMLHKGLAQDGLYAVNIADYRVNKTQFQIVERWLELSKKCGFEYKETVQMMLNTRPGVGNGKMDKVEKFEGIYIFKKT